MKSSCQESLTLISMAKGKKRATSGRQTENTTLDSPNDAAVASQREDTSPRFQSQSGVNAPPSRVTPQTNGNDAATPLTREDIPELIQQVVRGLSMQMGSGTQPGTVL